jgi:hypothetical protein
MKILGIITALALSPSFGYSLSSLSCTNYSGTVKVSEEIRDDQYARGFELEIKTWTLMGPQTLKFKKSELKITLNRDVVLEQSSHVVENWKGQFEKYTTTEFASKASFSRLDGKPILQDDTPDSIVNNFQVNLICNAGESEIVK